MGSVGMVGAFFGLPLDIRHITFAAGNLGLALVGMDWHMTTTMVVTSVIGIGLIGFMNFIVSFGLSLTLALRSRGIAVAELLPIIMAVWRYFLHFPLTFFFPHRTVAPLATSGAVVVDKTDPTPPDQVR
jgi:site-specific recombinase